MSTALLTSEEALDYWEQRHRTRDYLTSGGDMGLTFADNAIFYYRRLGMLLEIVGERFRYVEPIRALDAGCGKGWFAARLAECGFLVDAFDSSAYAIEQCRDLYRGNFVQATLHDFESPFVYDLVYSVDVLFHVLDDSDWRAALVNLASLVAPDGILVVTDRGSGERAVLGNYIVHRPPADYMDVLGTSGFEHSAFVPYRFHGSQLGMHVFSRAEARNADR